MIAIKDAWIVLIGLGLGSFLLRFSFIGLLGNRPLPEWVMRHLRYVAVAVLPGLVAPAVMMPAATGGQFDPPRAMAALAAIIAGVVTRNVLAAIITGVVVLYAGLWMTGAFG